MRILGIDYGDVRTGIAITDPLGITAQGLKTINNQNSDKILLREIEEIVNEYNVEKIVIGMPLNLRGEKTVRAEKTEKFIHKLKCKFGKMPVEKIDERLTTVQAHKTMNFLDVNKKNKKNIVDTIAAVYILETYMRKEEKNGCKKCKNSI